MALRPIDNALPIAAERPKKQAKISAPPHKEKPNFGVNDENNVPMPPPITADSSIDYIPSENLKPFPDPDIKIQGLVGGLESKDWLKVCESLNDARQLALFHPNILLPVLEKVMLVMVKAIKNPRSALCKTSIMASSDIFKAFGEKLLEPAISNIFDNLLLQLLLKGSQDKKFVCEEADRTLKTMVESTSPLLLLRKLRAYVGHSNLRVRAKAAVSISNCVSKMDLEGMKEFGLAELIQTAANLLNDKLPEAREAARSIVISSYEALVENEEQKQETWQSFCQSNLPAIHAQAIVKIPLSGKMEPYLDL
ncbi:TOG array regulator of axonemal microtubules 1 [Olea europaea subsp. europaea]|uniref:TOG array regulator of axonemal microtubules 1 n=1 Tax=Olea europaea subsp. europaea TaxID=158383 RepID=A0A8S0QCR6_OLEEU|nr:TOG array regulator of axonemal microtubules 1 [Olea europaea subsp. europaea]